MNRDTQSLLLLLIGGAVLKISIGDAYLRYVKEGLRPWLIVAGALLVILALSALLQDLMRRRKPAVVAGESAPAGDPGDTVDPGADLAADVDGHGHAGGPRVGWLLLLPVLAIFLVAPPALGSFAAERGDAKIEEPASAVFPDLPPGDPVPLTLGDYGARAIWDKGASLRDRTIQLTGFVTPAKGGGYYVTRLAISCCAADAQPIKVFVSGNAGSFAADQWIAVTGVYDRPTTDPDEGYDLPVIKATSVELTAEPVEPYEQ